MKHRATAALSALLLSGSTLLAQTGFTTKIYPARPATILRVADFNGDGKPDLFAFSPSVNANIYLNDGSGGFKAPVALPSVSGTLALAKIADMNGDGIPDIVGCTAAQSANGTVTDLVVYLNNGNGSFTISQALPLANICTSLAVGDVNLDGHQDVVIATGSGGINNVPPNNIFATFYGDGAGKVSTTPVIVKNVNLDSTTSGSSSTSCVVDDITGGNFLLDGQLSLLVNSQCFPIGQNYGGSLGTTFLAHGQGNGQFTFSKLSEAYLSLFNGQTVDINQDGRPDGLFRSDNGLQNGSGNSFALNNGGGSFTNGSPDYAVGNGGPQPVAFYGTSVGDLTGDGVNDLAELYSTYSASNGVYPTYLSILAGSKGGTYTESQHFLVDATATYIGDVVAADFNGDGKTDLATIVTSGTGATQTSSLHVYLNGVAPNSACAAPTMANTNVICQPVKGSSQSSTTVVVTAASNITGFTSNRLYLDNASVYQTISQTVNTPIVASTGSHTLVLVSYNNQGQAFTSTAQFTVTNGNPGGCLPSAAGVAICSPSAGSSEASPLTLTAGAIAQSGNITAIRAYIDNQVVATVNNKNTTNSLQISVPLNVLAGSHTLVVLGYQSTGGQVSKSESFIVSASSACLPPSGGYGIALCSPITTSASPSFPSPLRVRAGASVAQGYVAAIRVYVDNVAVLTSQNPKQSPSFSIDQSLSVASGKHTFDVVAYPSTGGSLSTFENLSVQ